jgi:hypothetical protein
MTTADNKFNPTLNASGEPRPDDESKLRIHMQTEAKAAGSTIDADGVLPILARWVGWYRLENAASRPADQLADAHEIVTLLTRLRDLMQPHNMSLEFRAHLQEGMRTFGVAAPDFVRLSVLAADARDKMPRPKQGKQVGTEAKYRAIRETYDAIRANTVPPMTVQACALLAAELVRDSVGTKVPTGRDELREITQGRNF